MGEFGDPRYADTANNARSGAGAALPRLPDAALAVVPAGGLHVQLPSSGGDDCPRPRRARHSDHVAPPVSMWDVPDRPPQGGEGVVGDRPAPPGRRPGELRVCRPCPPPARGAGRRRVDSERHRPHGAGGAIHDLPHPSAIDSLVLPPRGVRRHGDRVVTALAAVPVAWVERAASRGRDTSWWYATPDAFETRAALAICRRCPVRAPCLEEALAVEDDASATESEAG